MPVNTTIDSVLRMLLAHLVFAMPPGTPLHMHATREACSRLSCQYVCLVLCQSGCHGQHTRPIGFFLTHICLTRIFREQTHMGNKAAALFSRSVFSNAALGGYEISSFQPFTCMSPGCPGPSCRPSDGCRISSCPKCI